MKIVFLKIVLWLADILWFVAGYFSVSYESMTLALLFAWLLLFVPCLLRWEKKIVTLLFYISFFVFLVTRPLGNLFYVEHQWEYGVDPTATIFLCVYLSLLSLALGNFIGERISISISGWQLFKKINARFENNVDVLKSLTAKCFMITYIAFIFVSFERFVYFYGREYRDIYLSYPSVFPGIIRVASEIMPVFLVLCLVFWGRTGKVKILLGLYVLSKIPNLVLGARSGFIQAVFFSVTYLVLMGHFKNARGIERYKNFLIVGLMGICLIVVASLVGIIRSGNVVDKNFAEMVLNMFYNQGYTFDIISNACGYIDFFKYDGFKVYTLGEIADYIFHGNIAVILFGATPLGEGHTIARGKLSNDFGTQLAYLLHDGYLDGNGWGSSYVIEAYFDGGFVGLLIVSFMLGYIISKLEKLTKCGIFTKIVSLMLLTHIYYTPRDSVGSMLKFLVTVRFWGIIFLLYILAGARHRTKLL